MKDILKFVLWSCLTLILGYQIIKTENIHEKENTPSVPKISINLVQKKRNHNNTIYIFRFRNESKQLIKQCNVYLRYHVLLKQGIQLSPFKIEAMGNKLNIKPKEKLTIKVTIPKEKGFKGELQDIYNPELEVLGYVKEVKNDNKFRLTVKVDYKIN
ncbi:hypothetical protein [Gottfriedia acidiceleris]|uniref:hypothetical protein n=1 Tax=Gottfriedia acidiceleris TaxID=371036 RepID=UPI000B4450D8|nr:hypothetical protein [Gottfriedia acidiceleris]